MEEVEWASTEMSSVKDNACRRCTVLRFSALVHWDLQRTYRWKLAVLQQLPGPSQMLIVSRHTKKERQPQPEAIPFQHKKINERRTSHVTSRDQGAAASDQLPRTRAMQGTLNESLQHQLFSHRVLCGRSYILTYRAISRRKQCLFVGWVVGVAFESSRCSLPSI